jgi:hypothetical protein
VFPDVFRAGRAPALAGLLRDSVPRVVAPAAQYFSDRANGLSSLSLLPWARGACRIVTPMLSPKQIRFKFLGRGHGEIRRHHHLRPPAEAPLDAIRKNVATKADVQAVRSDLALVEHRLLTRLGTLAVVLSGLVAAAYWPPHQ